MASANTKSGPAVAVPYRHSGCAKNYRPLNNSQKRVLRFDQLSSYLPHMLGPNNSILGDFSPFSMPKSVSPPPKKIYSSDSLDIPKYNLYFTRMEQTQTIASLKI